MLRLFRAAHARPLQGSLGGALDADGAHRRQLHQHPDREAVRAAARRGRLCARRRSISTPAVLGALRLNTLFGTMPATLNALLVIGAGALALVLWRTARSRSAPSRWRCRSPGRSPTCRRLGRLAGHRHLREDRRGAGRHDDDRAGRCSSPIRRDAPPLAVHARRDRVRGRALRLRPRDAACSKASTLTIAAGREDRPGRPLRRRQVDGRQSAAALLRSRRRPHPDRRPGHRRRDAGDACARRSRW